ncbi:MAG: sulfatase-like hydrolase/transferase [Planctomycetota bacterium]
MHRTLLAAAAIGFAAAPTQADDRPNLLLIVADDLGYADLACYGATDTQTPHLDRLAAGGVTFTNFYANCCVCSPTRASLLTGRYPQRAGVPGVVRVFGNQNFGYLDPTAETLPDRLNTAGYDTALIGKWHLGYRAPNLPLERGFDVFRGWTSGMSAEFVVHRRHGERFLFDGTEPIDKDGVHLTELFTEWSQEYLADRAGDDDPFFLMLCHMAPHKPIEPPAEFVARVKGRHPDLSAKRAEYIAFVEHLDDAIGRTLTTLEQTGLAEDTLVVFVSDNGGLLGAGADNGPLRDGKGSMYEGGLKVPCIASRPGSLPAGAVSDATLLTMDLVPTFCAAASVDATPDGGVAIDGEDFSAVFAGEDFARSARSLYWVRRERWGGVPPSGKIYGPIEAVRSGDWKLTRSNPQAPFELYDLAADPGETTDLARERRDVVDRLRRELVHHAHESGRFPWQRPPAEEWRTEYAPTGTPMP